MNITDGLMINENQLISWNISFEAFKRICEKNNISHQQETTDVFAKISLPIEFANLGRVQATIYFINDTIKEVYITCINEVAFDIDRYINVDENLIIYFGKPKLRKKNKTLWKFGDIEIKHFYINKDDMLVDYLVLENIS